VSRGDFFLSSTSLRVQVCNLNPTFYISNFVIDGTWSIVQINPRVQVANLNSHGPTPVSDRVHVRRCALPIAVGRRLLPIRYLRISSRLILQSKIKHNLMFRNTCIGENTPLNPLLIEGTSLLSPAGVGAGGGLDISIAPLSILYIYLSPFTFCNAPSSG